MDKGFDLSKDIPYCDILEDARAGEFDGGHAAPPCGSFSQARYNEGFGPEPVRSLEEIYAWLRTIPGNKLKLTVGPSCL